jgi:outer membrane translocation and assembly module TamA
MIRRIGALSLLLLAALSVFVFSQSSRNQSSMFSNKVLVQELKIDGTTTLGTAELTQITNTLTGHEYADNPDDLQERLKDAFQQRGYFDATVTRFRIKPLDPLAHPKPIRVEADVNEGRHYRLGKINVLNAHLFPPEMLTKQFPLRTGKYFNVDSVRSGLGAVRELYLKQGYLDSYIVPNTQPLSNGTITMTLDVSEGSQYRMGAVKFLGDEDAAAQLATHWNLPPGEIYNATYIRRFLDENSALLPLGFTESADVQLGQNCRDRTVDVEVDVDPQHKAPHTVKNVDCDTDEKPAAAAQNNQTN